MKRPYNLNNTQQRLIYDFISDTLLLVRNNNGCYYDNDVDIICDDEYCMGCRQTEKFHKIIEDIKFQQAVANGKRE